VTGTGSRGERDFVLEEQGDGRAADIAAKTLTRLRRGDPAPAREIDLHGLDARGAERHVREALERARRDGVRCVRVIHGRGLHSESGAVLRDRLPHWLVRPPLAEYVLAFARHRRDGGGSTLVLLRRRERGPSQGGVSSSP
jgi:DNA-nicking Smr family endonuclease